MSNEQIKKDLLIQRAFLKKELEQLDIRREAFRTTCHMKQNYLEDIKKGSIIMR